MHRLDVEAFPSGSAGHRLVDHVGDCVIEAWGLDAESCLREALRAVVESFAKVGGSPAISTRPLTTRPLTTGPCSAEAALVALLEEVIFNLDVHSEVPVCFHLVESEDGGFAGEMEVVPAAAVELVGPVPKAVSYHDLRMSGGKDGWQCHVLIDL